MSGVNKVILLGRLGKDPEIRTLDSGISVATFSMVTVENWKDKKTGEKQERTTWHKIVAWGKLAELCADFLRKGKEAFVEGRIQIREYADKQGEKKQSFEIIAESVQFLGGHEPRKEERDHAEGFFGR